jgi:hypothetical protein
LIRYDTAFFGRIDKRLHRIGNSDGRTRAAQLISRQLCSGSSVLGRGYAHWSVASRRHWETPARSVILGARPVRGWVRFRAWVRGEGRLPVGILLFDLSSTQDATSAGELVMCARAVLDAADAEQVTLLARVARKKSRISHFYAFLGFDTLDSGGSGLRRQWMVRRPSPSGDKSRAATGAPFE